MSVYNSMNYMDFVKGKPVFSWYEKGTKETEWQSLKERSIDRRGGRNNGSKTRRGVQMPQP
jgi:hypothetical protein